MRDVFISIDNAKEVIQLPIPPMDIDISYGKNNNSFDGINGELLFGGNDALQEVSFSSFFPKREYPFLRDRKYKDFTYVDIIKKWKKDNKIIRLIINETNINGLYLIDDFNTPLSDFTGDVNFDISFKEYVNVDVKIKKFSNNTNSNKNTSTSTSNSGYYIITENRVNFRSGASTNAKIIGKFYKNDKIKLISKNGSWCYIDFRGTKGYVHADYVSKTASNNNSNNVTVKYQVVKRGSKGRAVLECQTKLNRHGFKIATDSSFGKATDKALRSFQKNKKLDVDGSCGPKTWKALNT